MGKMPTDVKEVRMHVLDHVEYPATKRELVKACSNMSDVPAKEKQWFKRNLPNKVYINANEVIKTLGI